MKILVIGDSWAAGEWTKNINGTHGSVPVLGSLLKKDGYEVVIRAHPGGSDIASLEFIDMCKNNIDLIIFYKTSTQRSLRTNSNSKISKKIKESFKNGDYNFEQAIADLDNHTFRTLEELDNRVFLIGGIGKVKQKVDVEYVLPSLIEELTNEEVPDYFDDLDILHFLEKYPEHFFPDGMHPNRRSIEYTYDLIKDKI
jgi:hypothetical protein